MSSSQVQSAETSVEPACVWEGVGLGLCGAVLLHCWLTVWHCSFIALLAHVPAMQEQLVA